MLSQTAFAFLKVSIAIATRLIYEPIPDDDDLSYLVNGSSISYADGCLSMNCRPGSRRGWLEHPFLGFGVEE